MIDVDMINARREELVEDLNKVRLRQEEIEKARLENVKDDAFIPSVIFPPKCNDA